MTRLFVLFMIILPLVSACKREDPNPQLSDPIYLDLVSEAKRYGDAAEVAEKKLQEAKANFEKTPIRTMDRKNAANEVKKSERLRDRAVALHDYYSIRAERRKYEATAAYKRKFAAGEAWPDKSEFEAYKISKRLSEASRNWSDRVPKPSHLGAGAIPSPESIEQPPAE